VTAASSTLARMAKRSNVSAGLLLFRRSRGELEVFLAHPGGPFWRNRDLGAWTVPKGLLEESEDPLVAAIREFEEETAIRPEGPFLPLGSVRQKAGKVVHA
jgi:predicted NUDIX family NTP pyrophosphohydrolase